MYTPKHFELKEHSRIVSFLKENSFALIVSSTDNEPVGTHLPFVIKEEQNNITLVTHLAKANSHAGLFAEGKETLVVFQGPHAYISPDFYEHKINVPTWNYTAIHVYGIPKLITEEEEMIKVLLQSFEAFDPSYNNQWNGLPDKYRNGLLKGIVALEIMVTRIQAKFKLSQNRTPLERERIVENFEKTEDYLLTGIARHMKENEQS